MENIFVGLIGSFLVLDTTVAFQFLISQPLIACTLIGWFLGDLQLGLQVGFYLQLLWLSSMPVGAAIVPEGNVAAIIITVLVLRYNHNYQLFNTVFVFSVCYGVFISYIGGEIVVIYRKTNMLLLQKVLQYASSGKLSVLTYINFFALLFHYSLMFLLITLSLFIGDQLFGLIVLMPPSWEIYFKYGVISILGIGAGLILPTFSEKKFQVVIVIGLFLGSILFFSIK